MPKGLQGFQKGHKVFGGFQKSNQFAKGNKPNKTSFKEGQNLGNQNGFKKGQLPWNKDKTGYSLTIEHRKKIRESHKKRVLEGKHNNYKGGITPINDTIRKSLEYRLWREAVFQRDYYTCLLCKYKSHKKINGKSDIQADHIKPFSLFPELRFELTNGRTLCIDCHRKTPTWGNRINKSLIYV